VTLPVWYSSFCKCERKLLPNPARKQQTLTFMLYCKGYFHNCSVLENLVVLYFGSASLHMNALYVFNRFCSFVERGLCGLLPTFWGGTDQLYDFYYVHVLTKNSIVNIALELFDYLERALESGLTALQIASILIAAAFSANSFTLSSTKT